ncbi:DUF4296 domain-containing protein [Aequorivita lipolytica]|uniref:DUF4296 domain-containing protein n=1 Tax=Aequorivita lipolytica TaxID=153267 RepID=A0A5C6YQN9_9FLAO|nr:DUF4296 domain-containing protein [Aequorivita lipolytica]TXD69293.1 DUF4296 domain-containing protein [Aequorivita lipolytica]SRX50085.1 hypothetical protein AEQU2_00551 [Aequorivita lipolytica]
MKHAAFLFMLMLSFFGCQNVELPKKPENLIPKDQMVDILTETYMSNAARSVNNQTIIDKGIKMDSLIYNNFGIDSLQFANSNAYYAADINSYMDIFQKVEARLTTMQKKMDSIREMEKIGNDTIGEKNVSVEPIRDSLI